MKKSKLIKVKCIHCGNVGATKYGKQDGQRYKCTRCGRTFRISSIPKNQRRAIPMLLHILSSTKTPIIEDIETNKNFNKATKTFIDASADYKLVETEFNENYKKQLLECENKIALLHVDETNKTINIFKINNNDDVISGYTKDRNNYQITIQNTTHW